jgi:hypothetical protein
MNPLLGMRPSPPDLRDWPLQRLVKALPPVALPPAVRLDYLVKRTMTQYCGDCVAYAGTAGMESYSDLPDGFLDPIFLQGEAKKRDGLPYEEGTYPRVALDIMVKQGISPQKFMPAYKRDASNCLWYPPSTEQARQAALRYRLKAYARAWNIDEMKQALAAGKLLKVGVLVTSSFMKPVDGVVPLPDGYLLGWHALLICGYDDTRQAFRFLNSWGPNWGDKAFGWLTYDFCRLVIYLRQVGPLRMVAKSTTSKEPSFKALEEAWVMEPMKAIGRLETLDEAPVIVGSGRMMAPVRWIIENSGGVVLNYENSTKTVTYRTAKDEIVTMQAGNRQVQIK